MCLLLHVTQGGRRSGVKDNQAELWETRRTSTGQGLPPVAGIERGRQEDMFIQINSPLSVARHVTHFEYWMGHIGGSKYPHLAIIVEIFTPAFERIFPIHDVVAVYGRLARWGDRHHDSSLIIGVFGVEISKIRWCVDISPFI